MGAKTYSVYNQRVQNWLYIIKALLRNLEIVDY